MTAAAATRAPREVLLVEDNPADVYLVRAALEESGVPMRITVATDGAAAIRALRQEGEYQSGARPDLVLLDLNIPVIDGREVLALSKGDEALWGIPVVVMTSSTAPQDIGRCYGLGTNGYVTKPIDLDGYLRVIRSIADFWLSVAVLPGPLLSHEDEDI
jgi:CheY-like chemotaxis protein